MPASVRAKFRRHPRRSCIARAAAVNSRFRQWQWHRLRHPLQWRPTASDHGDQGVFGMTALSRKNEPEPATAAAPALCLGARPDRRDAGRRAHQVRHRPLPPVHQAGEPEPRRLDQGPHRALDDRRGRALRPAGAGRHDRRGDRRQHRPRPGAGRHPEGLPHRAGRARQDVAREDPASARARRRGAHDPLRRRQGPSRILPGHGREDRGRDPRRLLRQPVRQPGQPAGA